MVGRPPHLTRLMVNKTLGLVITAPFLIVPNFLPFYITPYARGASTNALLKLGLMS